MDGFAGRVLGCLRRGHLTLAVFGAASRRRKGRTARSYAAPLLTSAALSKVLLNETSIHAEDFVKPFIPG
jgi:hypothetical protein